jgi:Domain of unknown function (DUF6968)
MTRTVSLGVVIAERRLRFEARAGWARDVVVRIGRPVQDSEPPHPWVCPVQVEGLGSSKTRGFFGEDSMQALLHGVHVIPVELAAYEREEQGTFLLDGGAEIGFASPCQMALDNSRAPGPADQGSNE